MSLGANSRPEADEHPAGQAAATAAATASTHLFATIIEEAFSEILAFDPETLGLLLVNGCARRNLGYTGDELRHLTVVDLKAGASAESVREGIAPLLSGRKTKIIAPAVHRRKDGAFYPIEEHSQLSLVDGRAIIFQTVIDQTDIGRLDAQAELLSYIELDASAAATSDDFIRTVLRRVTRHLGCSAGHAFVWDADIGALRSSGIWHFTHNEAWHACLREAMEAAIFPSGHGLAGRVHAEKAAVLAPSNRDDCRPDQAVSFSQPDLALPVFLRHDVAVVLEFYSTGRLENERLFHGLTEKIGMQVSRLYERKRAEEDLAETRDRFEAAARGANVGLWDYNHRTGKHFISERCKEIYGFTADSAPTDWPTFLDRVHPDDVERKIAAMTAHVMQRIPYDVEYRVRVPGGRHVWIHARGQGVWDEKCNIVRSVGTVDDVTAKKEAEFLRHEIMSLMAGNLDISAKIAATLERACRYLKLPVGIISHINDDQYEVLYSNSPTGLAPRGSVLPLAQTICSDVFLCEDVQAFPDLSTSRMQNHQGRTTLRAEAYLGVPFFVNGGRFGTLAFLSSSPRPGPFLEAEIAIMRLLALWIGEHIGRESYIASLVESDQRKTANLASVGDAVLTLSETGIVEDANPAAGALFGVKVSALCGMHIAELLPSASSISHHDGRLMPVSARHDIAVHSDGRRIAVLLHVSEVRLADRTVYAAALTDWTAVKQAETAKREFVSVVSHELRTPLTSIRGALGLIATQKTGPLTPATANLVHIAQRNSERLVRLVNDILDMEKLESGRFELDLQHVDLAAVLQEAVNANTSYAARFGVTYELMVEPGMSRVIADGDRLEQVMANLLSNGAKFTRPGTAVRVEARSNDAFARILVHDQGQGIPASLRSRLFEKFAQGDNSNTREREGSGLGLSISRQLARLMNGEVGLASSNNNGSAFFVEIPFIKPARERLAAERHAASATREEKSERKRQRA